MSDELVESIDLVPTFLSFFGGKAKPHIIEGRALDPSRTRASGFGTLSEAS